MRLVAGALLTLVWLGTSDVLRWLADRVGERISE